MFTVLTGGRGCLIGNSLPFLVVKVNVHFNQAQYLHFQRILLKKLLLNTQVPNMQYLTYFVFICF
uniref:Uncharacterized protein n=1 Tax=Anguilla anguilla TaxID=7936 RepID=A0A0E9WTC0_ANGAN